MNKFEGSNKSCSVKLLKEVDGMGYGMEMSWFTLGMSKFSLYFVMNRIELCLNIGETLVAKTY